MKKEKLIHLNIEIDELTTSIENVLTGEIFKTDIVKLTSKENHQIKRTEWDFNWSDELKNENAKVYKLTTINNATIIQGLISFTDNSDHIFIRLIENAKFNKGKSKLYKGVAGNLVAFACKTSYETGYDGVVAFVSKSSLIEHYKLTLGAKQFSGNRMYIDTKEAFILINQYF
ncbi:MAG: hypothetical protein ABI840_08140 [bacterium]